MIKVALVNITKDLECPPLNLAYLSAYLKKNNQVQIKIIDVNFDNILSELKKFNPDIVGISAFTIRFNYAKKLAKQIKRELKRTKIVIGGVHISTCQDSFSKEFDFAVLGEGEKTFSELISFFELKKNSLTDLKKIKGIMFWESGKIVKTIQRDLTTNLDEIPSPDRGALNPAYFKPKISFNKISGEKVIEAGMMTSRGCPYKCAFCSTSSFWSRIRLHSPEYVAREIKELVEKFNVNYIVIYDDFFAINVDRVKKIEQALKANNVKNIKFSCSVRANAINNELCTEMKKLGVVTVNFGFESGSDSVLKFLKGENITVNENINAVKICRKHGLNVSGSFIIGSPGEKIGDMKKTLELIKEMKKIGVTELWCGVATPYPGTKFWDYGIKNNLLKNFNWDIADPSYIHSAVFLDKSVPKKEFLKIFRSIKDECQGINPQQQPTNIRKIKEYVYYNPFLYKFAKSIYRITPLIIKSKLISLFNLRGNLITN